MPKETRECPYCHQQKAIKKNGRFFTHQWAGKGVFCPGSNQESAPQSKD